MYGDKHGIIVSHYPLKKGRNFPKWDYTVPVTKELGVGGKNKTAKINFHHEIEKESSVPWRMDSKAGFTKSCGEITFVYLLFTLHWV